MSLPLVSVIIPTFNRANYVVEAVESVLSQTYGHYEIIIIDDGSTDHTEEALTPYASAITYRWQPNQGVSVARNVGVVISQGDLLAFLDSDDRWLPDKLTAQVEALFASPECEAVFTYVQQYYSPELPPSERARKRCPHELQIGFCPSALMIWRRAFARVGGFDEEVRQHEFMQWMIRAQEAGLRSTLVEANLCLRRIHTHNKGVARVDTIHMRAAILKQALDRRRQKVLEREVEEA